MRVTLALPLPLVRLPPDSVSGRRKAALGFRVLVSVSEPCFRLASPYHVVTSSTFRSRRAPATLNSDIAPPPESLSPTTPPATAGSVSAALKILPEVHVEGVLGGSVVIECPLPKTKVRLYLCRETGRTGMCATVVSSTSYTKKEYMGRVTLQLCPDKNLFLVEVTELAESDSGDYACGAGTNTDRGKTQKVTLNVHSEYEPFWEEEPIMPEPPKWFYKFLHLHVPPWFQAPTHASSSKFTSKVTTQAQRTEAPPAHRPSPTTLTIRHPRVSRASSVAATKPPTLPPSTAASKISARERLLGPRTAGYGHHTRLHRQRAPNRGSAGGTEGPGFHILIPTTLGLFLLVLLGLLVKRAVQRRKALSRRVRRLALRMRALEASQRPLAQRPGTARRPRSQNNVYSACPRRARPADAEGDGDAPVPGPGTSAPPAPPAPPQDSEAPWLHASSLKTSCEYVSFYHRPDAKTEDSDSDDYINIPALLTSPDGPPSPDGDANDSCLSADFRYPLHLSSEPSSHPVPHLNSHPHVSVP
ncbi:immunoglobulin mu Fc receptor [Microcebus murinus]|uniref:immunoglobulin mu Fc receptor n=1 Tax=Microcebus murinus TaxID=30608 RepID=UPI003F6A90D4